MESNSQDKIVALLDKVIELLKENGERTALWWADLMDELRDNYVNLTHSATKQDAANDIRRVMLGGMGSFTDFLLHKDGELLSEENHSLADLRSALFTATELVIYGKLSPRLEEAFVEGKYEIWESDTDGIDVYFRASASGEPLGKFFFGSPESAQKALGELQSGQRMYALRLPIHAVIRYGKVAIEVDGTEQLTVQMYIDKPWHTKGIKIVPLEEAGEILQKAKELEEELRLRISGQWKDVEGKKSPLAEAAEKVYL